MENDLSKINRAEKHTSNSLNTSCDLSSSERGNQYLCGILFQYSIEMWKQR